MAIYVKLPIAEGPQGDPGPAGPTGPAGATGATGPAGPGVVVGGTTGQLLAKQSNTNYDTTWVDVPVVNNLTASTTVAPSKTAVNTGLGLKVNKAGDTMTDSLTVTGNNGLEFPGLKVNNTNLAGYCAINARADDGEVIQIAALNSGGAANAYGMWTANQFGLYSKRTLNILTDTAGAEIKFATGTGGTQVAKIDSTGKFSSQGISLSSGTVENVPAPTLDTHAANKAYADSSSIINALIFG